MLIQLTVQNLAIVTQLDLSLSDGMLVITGETGAGKSIIIDALSIALGERASAEQIRAPHNQAIVTASFDITKLPAVQKLLEQQDLPYDECVIRRVISSDGRSRAYINGHSVAVQQIKSLAPYLVQIHSQNQHHALLDSDYQRQLLDSYAAHQELLDTVITLYTKWYSTKQQIQTLTDTDQQTDRLTLLNYQIQELDNLNLQDNELQQLDQQHTQLAKAEELIAAGQESDITTTNILEQLHIALQQLTSITKIAPSLSTCVANIKQAIMQIEDSNATVQDYFNKINLDPQQLETIERRLSNIHALARKLKVAPEQLHEHSESLRKQRDILATANDRLEQLQHELLAIEKEYNQAATRLALSRKQAAAKLSIKIIEKLKTLEMPNATFEIKSEPLKHNNPTPYGKEAIHFTVTTNPGQPLGLLKKIASGGELSRISLAIQVITAQQMATPTLIMDEVDVGISGKTAATVGSLMRELGANAQILCITHLPQVAAQGHKHFKVEKLQTAQETTTQIVALTQSERVIELARLMGGATMTPEALAHASKLIEAVE